MITINVRGVKIVRRGTGSTVRVGFFYAEYILAYLKTKPEGATSRQIALKTKISQNTVVNILKKLEEMNRVKKIGRMRNGRRKIFWLSRNWRIRI